MISLFQERDRQGRAEESRVTCSGRSPFHNQVDADHQRTSPVDGYPGPKGPRAPTTRTKAPSPSEIPTGPQRNAASRGRSSSTW